MPITPGAWVMSGGTLVRKGRPSRTPPAPQSLMILGLFNSTSRSDTSTDGQYRTGDTSTNFRNIVDDHMDPAKVKVRRCFSSTIPSSWANTSAAGDAALGLTSCLSVKAPPADVNAGTWDANITSLAGSAPAGSMLVYYHEPENDVAAGSFTAADWSTAFQRFYTRVKAANPAVLVVASHMTYQWGSGMSSTATTAPWSVQGKADMVCTDSYFMEFGTGYTSLADEPRHQRWHTWAKTQGVPIGLTEFGIVHKFYADTTTSTFTRPYTDAQRATLLGNSLDWMRAQDYRMCLYWNSYHGAEGGGYRDWNITDTGSDPEDYPLTLAAWNDRVATYGSTGVAVPS